MLSDDQLDLLVDLLIEGWSPVAIAREIGADEAETRRIWRDVMSDQEPEDEVAVLWNRARVMREQYAAGGVCMADLAREYDVSYSTARKIIHNKTWKVS